MTCSLCTSPPFCAYASSIPLPEHLQGSIPGPWLVVTWAGITPLELRGIAKPQPQIEFALGLATGDRNTSIPNALIESSRCLAKVLSRSWIRY